MSQSISKKDIALWAIVFGVPLLFYILPTGMDAKIQLFLALTLWAVLAWMFSIIPAAAVGATLPSLFFFAGLAPAEAAYAPWFNSVIWGGVTILLVGLATDKTGIARRIAYALILRFNCNLKGLVWAFAGAGIVLAVIIIDPMGRAVILTSIALGIVRALDIPLKSREATALGLAAFFGMSGPGILIYTSGNGIYINSVYRHIAGNINYLDWFIANLVLGLLWTVASAFLVIHFFKLKEGRCLDAREVLLAHQRELGPMKASEKMTLFLLILLVVDYIAAPFADQDPMILSVFLIPFFFLPKFGMLTHDDMEGANLKILFVMTGAMSIGSVAGAVGLVDLMIESAHGFMGRGPIIMTIATFFFSVLGNFVLTPLAIIFTFTEALTEMAQAYGYNPLPVIYAMNFGTDVYIFPYEYAILLICFGFGLMDQKLLIKALCLRTLIAIFLLCCVAVPYWYLLGYFAH